MAEGGDQDTLTEGRPNQNPADAPKYGDSDDENLNNLLTYPERRAAAFNYKLWKSQPKESRQRRRAQWRVNKWRREGRSNVYVQKVQDKGIWQAWEPPWTSPPVPVLNKAARLCRRLTNMSFADPPIPEGIPATDEDEDIEAVRLSERILIDIQSEANLDDLRAHRRAFHRAGTYGSGFIRYYIDPRGGGKQPVRIMAKPGAVSAEQPFLGENGEELQGELIARYVMPDGSLSDKSTGAATRWMPALKKELIGAANIRFLPHDSEDIWDAEGVIIGTMPTWGEIESLYPEVAEKISEEDKLAILGFKPENAKDLLGLDEKDKSTGELRQKDKRVAVFTTYYKSCPLYPQGCYFVGLGDRVVLERRPWVYEPEQGDPEVLEIPITQQSQFDDDDTGNPFGLGLMDMLGNGSELRASQVGHLLQFLDRFANQRTFLPTNSIIQPKQLQLMAGATIPINPGGEPKYEELPNFPREPLEMFSLISEEMDDHSMMQETAQGTEVPGVNSGRQAAIIVQQAMASLSEIRQNIERGYIRACRIELQQIRMGYTVPQQISWTGEDGQHHQKWWSGSDLRGTADFRLKQGSLSMMTAEQKMNMALQFKQAGAYDQNPDLFYDALTSTLGPVVGMQEDPSRVRIKRQLATWGDGPPEGWLQQQQAAAAQASAAAPMAMGGGDPLAPGGSPMAQAGGPDTGGLPGGPGVAGQPGGPGQPPPPDSAGPGILPPNESPDIPAPPAGPPPLDPVLAGIFERVEADELPDVATVRLSELKRFMASTRFTRWPVEWRQGVVQEFQHMKLCAGVQTVPEQIEQQQQAAQAQEQAADKQFQQQVALEQAKAEGHAAGNGRSQRPLDLKIDRDPTGRLARLRESGPPSNPPSN